MKSRTILLLAALIICTLCMLSPDCAADAIESYKAGNRSLISFSLDNPYLPLLALMGVVLAIASFYFPRFGLLVMLLFMLLATDMPVGKSEGMERAVTIRIEDIVLLLVSGGWLLNRARTRSLGIVKFVPLYTPILAMSGVIILSTILGYFQDTVSINRGFFFAMKRLEYFWIFFMALNLMETSREALNALRILLFASVIITLIGTAQFFFFPVSELSQGGATATAGFGRANTMGDFLLMMVGIASGMIIYAETKRSYLLNILLCIGFSVALIMTKSRGAYVSIPPMIAMIFLLSRDTRIIRIIIGGIVFVGLYMLLVNLDFGATSQLLAKHDMEISQQFTQIGDVATQGEKVDPSLHSRILAWKESVDQIISYPVLGSGSKKMGYADNQYVQELLESGIIGFCVFMYMNLCIFVYLFNIYRQTGRPILRALCLGFMGGHTGMMVHGITMTNFYTIFNMEVFWFLLAIICLLRYNEQREYISEKETDGTNNNSPRTVSPAP